MQQLKGRVIYGGRAAGPVLFSPQAISFFGGVNPETGQIVEQGHPLQGQSLAGKILVFPCGKGSTVGSYILARLKKNGVAPKGMILARCEPIVAIGAIIAEIPCLDLVDIEQLAQQSWLQIEQATISNSSAVTSRVLLKLGGSAITQKAQNRAQINAPLLQQIAREILQARQQTNLQLCIVHGAGPFGHRLVAEYGLANGVKRAADYQAVAHVHASVAQLNGMIYELFAQEGLVVFPLQPSAMIIQENKHILSFHTAALEALWQRDMIPLLYGDMVMDRSLGASVVSGDQLICYLASKLEVHKVLMGCDVDGVLSQDPQKDAQAQLVPLITDQNFEQVCQRIGSPKGQDVTGGMRAKLENLRQLASVRSFIFNLHKQGYLQKLLVEKPVPATELVFAGKSPTTCD